MSEGKYPIPEKSKGQLGILIKQYQSAKAILDAFVDGLSEGLGVPDGFEFNVRRMEFLPREPIGKAPPETGDRKNAKG